MILAAKVIAVTPPPVRMMALVMTCAMSTKEGSAAHALQALWDTDVNSHPDDHVKK